MTHLLNSQYARGGRQDSRYSLPLRALVPSQSGRVALRAKEGCWIYCNAREAFLHGRSFEVESLNVKLAKNTHSRKCGCCSGSLQANVGYGGQGFARMCLDNANPLSGSGTAREPLTRSQKNVSDSLAVKIKMAFVMTPTSSKCFLGSKQAAPAPRRAAPVVSHFFSHCPFAREINVGHQLERSRESPWIYSGGLRSAQPKIANFLLVGMGNKETRD